MLQEKTQYVSIIPLRRVPDRFELLTYTVPTGMLISRGLVVKIPFGKSEMYGVVWNTGVPKPTYTLKSIVSITDYLLPSETMHLIEQMRSQYSANYGTLLELFVSDSSLKILNKKSEHQVAQTPNIEYKKTAKKKLLTTLYIEKSHIDRAKLIGLIYDKNPRTMLVVVPEITTLKSLMHSDLAQKTNICFISGESTPKERALAWQNALLETCPTLFITTRVGLFLPFSELAHVVVLDDESESHQEIHKPSYHSTDIARLLSQNYGAHLSIISATPRLETWHKTIEHAHEKNAQIFNLTTTPESKTKVEIISMPDERRKGITGAFAEASLSGIAAALSQNKQALIFINRRGQAGMVICKDCHEPLTCPSCHAPLSLHDSTLLRCHHCGYENTLRSSCPNCHGISLIPIMMGTQAVEKSLNKIFDRAKVVRLDSDSLTSRKKTQKALSENELNEADIIIATRLIDKPLSLPRLSISVALMPDLLLNIPNFLAQEKALQSLNRLKINTHGTLIIQTYVPESLVYQTLLTGDLESFYKAELETRRILKLPPF